MEDTKKDFAATELDPNDIELSESDEAIGRTMIAYSVLERLLVTKGIITEEEIKIATTQIIKHFAEAAQKSNKNRKDS